MTLHLPPQFHGSDLFPFIARLSQVQHEPTVTLDFAALRRISPAGIVALVCTVQRWIGSGKAVEFSNLNRCPIVGYLQRMDVFKACGISLVESFQRHLSRGKFQPIQKIGHQVDLMGDEIASCLAPGGEELDHPHAALYDLAWYVFTEIANNARQHSRGTGYTAAQVNREEGLVRIAIGDNGRGIRSSFVEAGLEWSKSLSDADCILSALQSGVSSKGRPTNEGVGLTMVSGLVAETNGWLLVVSGSGVVTQRGNQPPQKATLPGGMSYEGTLVVPVFRQKNFVDFAAALTAVKVQAGLLRQPTVS